MSLFALLDCNNFYVSCERIFNPALEKRPVVVLSNNDGCVISRSKEAKQLGIPMGAPFFKWEKFCKQNKVAVYSSNYELYGDISRRVMNVILNYHPKTEIYSIDEAFLNIVDIPKEECTAYLQILRNKILQDVGVPTSIGFSTTKTLAKVANHLAKIHISSSVIGMLEPKEFVTQLQEIQVDKVWGVGRNLARRLNQLGIKTIEQLRQADSKKMRLHFSVSLEKTIQELQGISCIPLEAIQPRKQIVSSRSFGKAVTKLTDLEEAVSLYITTASHKLRLQKSKTSAVYVFIHTNIFKVKEKQHQDCVMLPLAFPTADTAYLISVAKSCVRHLYKKGYRYHKAGIILSDLSSAYIEQYDLMQNKTKEHVAHLMDEINDRLGKETIFYSALGINRRWKIKRDKLSLRATTQWHELVQVYC